MYKKTWCTVQSCCFANSTHCLLIRQVFLITVHAKLRKLRVNYKRPNITSLLSEKKVLANNERCTPRSTCKQWRHRTAAILVHVCLVAAYFVFPDLIRTTLIGFICLFPKLTNGEICKKKTRAHSPLEIPVFKMATSNGELLFWGRQPLQGAWRCGKLHTRGSQKSLPKTCAQGSITNLAFYNWLQRMRHLSELSFFKS